MRGKLFGMATPISRRAAGMRLSVRVKRFDPAKGFGFVVPEGGGAEAFEHAGALFRSGMTGPVPGQRVFIRAESVPRGQQVTAVEPL